MMLFQISVFRDYKLSLMIVLWTDTNNQARLHSADECTRTRYLFCGRDKALRRITPPNHLDEPSFSANQEPV